MQVVSEPKVIPVYQWEKYVDEDVAYALTQKQFSKVEDGEAVVYLTGVARATIHATLINKEDPNEIAEKGYIPTLDKDMNVPISVVEQEVIKVMRTIGEDLNLLNTKVPILGYLSLPATMKLAITDLSIPVGVFCFPVVDSFYLNQINKSDFKTMKDAGTI